MAPTVHLELDSAQANGKLEELTSILLQRSPEIPSGLLQDVLDIVREGLRVRPIPSDGLVTEGTAKLLLGLEFSERLQEFAAAVRANDRDLESIVNDFRHVADSTPTTEAP